MKAKALINLLITLLVWPTTIFAYYQYTYTGTPFTYFDPNNEENVFYPDSFVSGHFVVLEPLPADTPNPEFRVLNYRFYARGGEMLTEDNSHILHFFLATDDKADIKFWILAILTNADLGELVNVINSRFAPDQYYGRDSATQDAICTRIWNGDCTNHETIVGSSFASTSDQTYPGAGVPGTWVRTNIDLVPNDDIVINLEEPSSGDKKTGVGNLRGWAVAPAGIQRIEFYLDDDFKTIIPYGGVRKDVGSVFEDFPESDHAGFSMAYNYSLLDPGLHDFRIRAVDKNGGYKDDAETIETVRFHKSFFTDPTAVDLSSSTVSRDGARVLIENLMVDGEPYDVQLRWRKESQDFDIIDIE